MLVVDIFRLSTRMFRTNRLRTILTILGISVGISTILFLVSFGYGLQRVILNRITTSDSLLSLDVSSPDQATLKLSQETLSNFKGINGVDKISPLITLQAQIVTGDISSELSANFADSDYFKLEGTRLQSGKFYTDDQADYGKMMISANALQLFNLTPEQAYERDFEISVYLADNKKDGSSLIKDSQKLPRTFKVVGIVDDDAFNYVFLPLADSQELGAVDYTKLKIKVDKQESLNLVRGQIIEKGFSVSALSDTIEQANQIFHVVQIVLGLFGIVALIVSAIGMFNTMTIALLERIQEIGIMKALGATNLDIWNMFLGESVIIGFSGGLGGVLIGFLSGKIFNYGLNILASALGGEKINLFYTPYWFMIFVVVFSTLVGVFTGVYPASRAAKINCLEALRYK